MPNTLLFSIKAKKIEKNQFVTTDSNANSQVVTDILSVFEGQDFWFLTQAECLVVLNELAGVFRAC
jgi:hypothetical protein